LNIADFLDEGTHRFCTRLPTEVRCVPVKNASEFASLASNAAALGPSTYLDIGGNNVSDYHGPETCQGHLLDCGTAPRSAIYYHVIESNDRFYIDYWWFLRFNHFAASEPGFSCQTNLARQSGVCDEHEGDWEGITVVTPPDDDKHIAYVVYAAHKGTFRYTPGQLHLQPAGSTHPVVFIANGSHAAYPQPCLSEHCSQPTGLAAGGLVDLPEGNYDGKAGWSRNAETCKPNSDDSCLQSLNLQPWNTWPGQWGAGCGAACGGAIDANSPRSPGVQARYQTPWCSTQDNVFSCDGRALSCSDWLGPLVVAVACDPGVLSTALQSSDATKPTVLALIVRGQETAGATTPGVVQVLGQPLRPPTTFTAIADGKNTEILVRAQQAGVTVEDRFAKLPVAAGQHIVVRISRGSDGPVISANRYPPIERRILEPLPRTSTTGTPR
jgi:hypothetical protein